MSNSPRPAPRVQPVGEKSRLVALSVAGCVCFFIAVATGYGAWHFFGTHEDEQQIASANLGVTLPAVAPPATPQPLPTEAPTPEPTPEIVRAPAGEANVPGGEVVLGGEGTDLPLRREFVDSFSIGETEVTNEQYGEFVSATGHKSPAGWTGGEFPEGKGAEPVTNVTWADAVAYCEWLSERVGAIVRLPTEAEWTLAARGADERKYPWGDEWKADAAISAEDNGRLRPVRSFPAGRSPVGAYEMAGNAWELTGDAARDAAGKLLKKDGATLRVVKGGAADEERDFLTTTARAKVKETEARPTIGFRYVIVRAGDRAEGN